MKLSRPGFALSLLLTFVFTTLALGQTAPPIRIMPLGDSITLGSGGTAERGGYRGKLYDLLTEAGYNVDFVGTQTNNSSAIPDRDHQGHSGWRIDQIDSNIVTFLNSIADPDVVLLHIGTNDFGGNNDTPNAINRLDSLIYKIANLRPFAHIIVTNLMERDAARDQKIEEEFNPLVPLLVSAHASMGRRVTFLDMRAAVPLADMPDQLHPNQTGYDKMAAAWFQAVKAIVGVNGDSAPPEIVRAQGLPDQTKVAITFSKPVADSAANLANFSVDGGLTLTSATLDATKRVVTLTTSAQTRGTVYTLTINNITDRITPTPNALPANTVVGFLAATPPGYLNNVPESTGYTLVHTLDIPVAANFRNSGVPYALDNRKGIGSFDRVAYYMELQRPDGDLQYLWVSMDAFTSNINHVGVPTLASGAMFQQNVAGMNVASNVPGIETGTGLPGNIEFWGTNYSAGNALGVPGASGSVYDFGDTRTNGGNYGSMQVHNPAAAQTLFAFNNWGGNSNPGNLDIGIGNNSAPVNGGVDWTFAHNAGEFVVRRLQVLVRTTGDNIPPTLVAAAANFGRTSLRVTFSEPIHAASVKAENFTLNNGVSVLGATLAQNQRDVTLQTSLQPNGTPLTLTVSGVRDTSPSGNRIIPGSSIAVALPSLPAEVISRVGAAANGYQLVQTLEIPAVGNFNALGAAAYVVDDRLATGAFRRVAYYLELERPGEEPQFVWAAMDAFTAGRGKLGIPTVDSGAIFQRPVTNLDVISNVSGVVTGTAMTGGNIEFWPNNYSEPNAANVPNASATAFDFGDTRATSGGNYGSMQVHNSDAAQTIFAINHFGTDGNVLDVGIGTQPTSNPDWTFAANAGSYSRRVLHVLVLPGSTAPADLVTKVPEAVNYQLAATVNIPAMGNLNNNSVYALDQRADVGPFSRIAYYMELKSPEDVQPQYIWVSMPAYTTDPTKIGVPTSVSRAIFQQVITDMTVASNVPGIVTGSGINTGNIEFWPTDYSAANALNIPGASGSTYDFGDTRSTGGSHGSMQIHNYGAGQTLFSITNWGNGSSTTNVFGLGIGNRPTAAPDWTFAANSDAYESRLLQVYVLPGHGDVTGPAFERVAPSTSLNRLVVTFNEPVAESAATVSNFSIDGGITVTSAKLLPGNRDIMLTTSQQTAGAVYTITGSGIRDRSAGANPIPPGSSITFRAYTPPALFGNVPELQNYELIYHLAIPSAVPSWNLNPVAYSINEAQYADSGLDRVAYLMELDGNWVYTSFDAFTNSISKIGVPTLGVSTTAFQQKVSNMNVASNVPGIEAGTGIKTGNIEFWGGNYSAPNALGIPNGSATLYDFGDTMGAGGHGTMQVHNHGAGQVLFAYNNWGSNLTGTSEMGIGNRPTGEPDWTFAGNAGSYTTRNLYVFARRAPLVPSGPAPQLLSHPASQGVENGGPVTLSVQVTGTGPFTYQWRRNGVAIEGATNPWLDLAAFSAALAGTYDVVVTGPNGMSIISQPAVLTVTNGIPRFSGFSFTVNRNEIASVPRASILAKATDADGDPLTITGAATASQNGGTVSLQAASILYTPRAGFLGLDSFTVTIADGKGGNAAASIIANVTTAVFNSAGQSTIASRVDGKMDVLFHGTPGQTYRIQRSTDLTNWTTVATVAAGDDGLLPFTDSNPPDDKAFYRTVTP